MADPRRKQCSISITSNSTSISSSDTRHSGSISFSSGCLWISFYVTVFTWLWTHSLNRILCGNVGWSSIKDDSCGILSEERATHVPLSSFQPKQPITTHMDTCVIMPCHVEEEPLGHILCQLTWRWRGRRNFLSCGRCGSLGQLPPVSEALVISDILPVPLSRLCWKSQLSVRLNNTCNFQSEFPANTNLWGASLHDGLPR